jgi:hypothetical protein
MKNTSYKFTVPADKYDDFKTDIEGIAQAIKFDREIKFDDAAKTVFFDCDSRAIWLLFEKNLSSEKAGKYDFICCAPTDYKDCQRFENGELVTFQEAQAAEMTRYADLAPTLKENSLGKVGEEEIDPAENLVISEYHPDLHPKRKLMDLLPKLGPDTTLVLERLPASQNAAVQKWLKDGDKDSELPPALRAYCDLVDQSNLEQAPPAASGEYRAGISSATKDILFAAKQSGVDVMFLENEHTDFDANRHKHLVVALSDLMAENPSKKFVLFCGIDHENRSMNEATLSDAMGANSCRILDEVTMGPEFHRRGCEADGKHEQEAAKKWFSYAAEAGFKSKEKETWAARVRSEERGGAVRS